MGMMKIAFLLICVALVVTIEAIKVKQASLEGCTLDGLTARDQMLHKYDVVKRLATMDAGEYVDLIKLKGSSQ